MLLEVQSVSPAHKIESTAGEIQMISRVMVIGWLLAQGALAQTPGTMLLTAKTVFVETVTARPVDPIPPKTLAVVEKRAVEAVLRWGRYRVSPQRNDAELVFRMEVDEHYRYGLYHSQIAPAVFLRVQDRESGKLLYCAWHRAGFFASATERLVKDLEKSVTDGDLAGQPPEFCGADAARPAHR